MTERTFAPIPLGNGQGIFVEKPRSWPADNQDYINALYRMPGAVGENGLMWIDNNGIERECPHGKYGDSIPTHEDARMLMQLMQMAPSYSAQFPESSRKAIADACMAYVRQFRDVAGPEKEPAE